MPDPAETPAAAHSTGPGDESPTRRTLVRSSALVAVGTGLSRITGLVRTFAFMYALGQVYLADTYTIANNMPNILYELLLGGVLSATLVPIFTERLKRDDGGTSAVVTVAALMLVVVTVVGFIAAPWIFALYGTALTDASPAEVAAYRDVGTLLLRFLMPQVFFYGLITLVTALLHARRTFLAPAYAPVLNNLVVSAMLFALPTIAGRTLKTDDSLLEAAGDTRLLAVLGIGTTIGVAAMALTMVPSLIRQRPPLRFNPDFRHPAVRSLVSLSGWTVGYVVANQLAVSVIYWLAQSQDAGNVTAYLVAFVFFQLPHGLFSVSVMTTFMPELTSAAQAGDDAAFRERFALGMRLMALVVLPASFGYMALALPIVDLLPIGSVQATGTTAGVLVGFSVGLFGFSVYLFALRGFYARKNTKTPFFLNLGENLLNLALALPLVVWLGVQGLAFAYSAAYLIAAVLALRALGRVTGGLGMGTAGGPILRMAVAAAACAGVAWGVSELLSDTSSLVRVLVAVPVGVAVYAGGLLVLRVEEVATAKRLVQARLRARSAR
jgi:putative peptidoglycan lipid II flippase